MAAAPALALLPRNAVPPPTFHGCSPCRPAGPVGHGALGRGHARVQQVHGQHEEHGGPCEGAPGGQQGRVGARVQGCAAGQEHVCRAEQQGRAGARAQPAGLLLKPSAGLLLKPSAGLLLRPSAGLLLKPSAGLLQGTRAVRSCAPFSREGVEVQAACSPSSEPHLPAPDPASLPLTVNCTPSTHNPPHLHPLPAGHHRAHPHQHPGHESDAHESAVLPQHVPVPMC